MLNLENRNRIFAICLCFFCLSLECFGDDESTPTDWQAKIDQFFGEHVVSPIADLLFWKIPGTHYYEDGSPVYFFSSSQVSQLTDRNATGGNYTFDQGELKMARLKDDRWEYPENSAPRLSKPNTQVFRLPQRLPQEGKPQTHRFHRNPKGLSSHRRMAARGRLVFSPCACAS